LLDHRFEQDTSTDPYELCECYQVAKPTNRQAMAVLRERGLIVTLHGRGSVVVDGPAS